MKEEALWMSAKKIADMSNIAYTHFEVLNTGYEKDDSKMVEHF